MTPPRRALIVIDVQREYQSGPLAIAHPPLAESLAAIDAALEAAATANLPVADVRHENPAGAAAFAADAPGSELLAHFAERQRQEWKQVTKRFASAFAGTDLADWCHSAGVDTITLVGYMANNCLLATAADAAPHGLRTEVLADATGTINLGNDRGSVPAPVLHNMLMTLLHSNFAAVTTTPDWVAAVSDGRAVPGSNLIASASAHRA